MILDRRQFLSACGLTLLGGLVSTPDALALDALRIIDYPERPVREFLKAHYAGTRAFTARGMDNKERYLTRRFRQGLFKFFERQMKSDGKIRTLVDPFTGSPGAADYAVGDGKVRVEKAWVPVNFNDGRNSWTTTYVMRNDQERNDDTWRIDDIQDVRGMLLSDVLKKLK